MSYMGISRGPDMRTDEQKIAADNIVVCASAYGFAYWFMCQECGQSDMTLNIEHKPECKTGQILDAMVWKPK